MVVYKIIKDLHSTISHVTPPSHHLQRPHPTPFICLSADDPPVLFSPHIHLNVNMHKNVRHSLPPSKYTHNRCPYLSPTTPPKINPSRINIYPRLQLPFSCIPYTCIHVHQSCRYCSLTLSRTFAITKAASDTSDAQILPFIIYTIFNKIYIFFLQMWSLGY